MTATTTPIHLIIADLEDFTEREMIALGLAVTEELVIRTPVDTGWARANWVPSISVPYEFDAPNEGDPGAARSRQEQGKAELAGYMLERGPIFCTNNVPYIGRLNEGWSAQAPAGYVQAGAEAAVRRFI